MVTVNTPQTGPGMPIETTDRGMVAETGTTRNYMLMRGYLSWGAIIAGSVLTLAILMLSASFAYACNVPAYSGGAYGWGAGLWTIVTSAIAFYCGGCVASYFASAAEGRFRFLHGVMVWGLTLPLLSIFFMGTLNMLVNHTNLVAFNSPADRIHFPGTGAAWGSFLSLMCGLIFAAFGAVSGSAMHERLITTSR